MKIRMICVFLACIMVNGCTAITQLSPQTDRRLFEMSDWSHFSIQSPSPFLKHIVRDDGSIALTSFDTSSIKRIPSDYAVTLFPSISIECSETITGASSTQPLAKTNREILWGKVDAYDRIRPDFPPGSEPFCKPPVLQWDYNNAEGAMRLSNDAAYALCSTKNGKTVVVCVEQVTDNPKLAEEIFSTFKWTE